MKKKIGFIYFDEIHHIHHFLGSFIELYNRNNYEVRIITYQGNKHTYLFELLKKFGIPSNVVILAPTYRYREILNKFRKKKRPSIHFLFKKNRKFLSKFDVLVYNVAQQKYMVDYKGKNKSPKLVYLDHGAGDANYVYNERITNFDLVCVAGEKVLNLCHESADFTKVNIKPCGYQKFETVKTENKNARLFDNDKPVVVYNPHFKEKITSYYKNGKEILDFFYNNENYNLIFAPHLMLFNRKDHLNRSNFNEKYFNKNNIHIDFGSVNSVNMQYVLLADVYLGDVSSQVYEFLIKPRPCIFVNSHGVDWKKDKHYANWKLGKVISDISELDNLLKTMDVWSKDYTQIQKEIFHYTFGDQSISASKKIVDEIIKLFD